MRQKMQQFCRQVIATVCAASMVLGGVLSDIGAVAVRAAGEHTLWLVGDSTVCAFDDQTFYPRYGYGTQVGNYLDDTYTVRNLAVSGASSKSFISHDNYTTLTGAGGIQAGDALVIGFGHNDEKDQSKLYTDANGDWETEGSFAKSLYDNYVRPAQDAGAEAILCTPIVRRSPDGSFTNHQLHITADKTTESVTYKGGDYPRAIRELGAAKGVPVVDLTTLTQELYTSLGAKETLYLHAWNSHKEASVDNTHLNFYGAKQVAWLFADAVSGLDEELALKEHINAGEAPSKDTELPKAQNPDYVITEYTRPGDDAASSLYSDYVIGEGDGAVHFKGTAFGNLSGSTKPSAENHILGTDGDGNMRVAVKNNKSKIDNASDGIAMYYYRVPVDSSFELSAKATINEIDLSSSQVAFGLMVRDDMYIDTGDATIASNYAAAGSLGAGCNCFYRKDGKLGGKAPLQNTQIAKGSSYNLSIQSTGEGTICTFNNETAQVEGYDFLLNGVDDEYVYIGMFAARNADVSYSQIYLKVDGQVVVDNRKTEYAVTVISAENGSAQASKTSAAEGETVRLTATPDEGWLFKEWQVVSGGVTVENDQFTMPANAVEVKAVFEKLRTEWNFQADDAIAGKKEADGIYSGNGVYWEGQSGVLAGLQIDATNGKWDSRDSLTNGWAQFNANTVITVPVEGPCKVTVVGYSAGYTVDGVAASVAGSGETFVCEGKNKKAVITATENTYLRSIKVEALSYLAAGETDFTKLTGIVQNGAIPPDHIKGMNLTDFTWNGAQHGLAAGSNAVMTLSLPHKANVSVTTCTYGAGANATVTASSGKVSCVPTTEEANGTTGLKFAVEGAEAGDLKLTFGGGSVFIHNIFVDYIIEIGPRNIDVWDMGGKEETDTRLYTNNITPEAWIESGAVVNKAISKEVTFGDLTITPGGGDRLYSNIEALKDLNYGGFAAAQNKYEDGYQAAGAYYTNGTGGSTRRYLTIANVQAGDKIVAYMGAVQKGDTQFFFEGLGGAAGQKETVEAAANVFGKYELLAEKTGSYKIWENNAGKPMWHRVMRVPGVSVSGTIHFGEYAGTGHSVKFINQTTKKATEAVLDGSNYTATLAAGYTYTAVLSGATGYGFSAATKTVVTVDEDCIDGKSNVNLMVEPKSTYTYSGKITGFAEGYDVSGLTLTMAPPADSNMDEVSAAIDENLNFTATLEPDVAYTIQIAGVNDYELKGDATVEASGNYQADITVGLKAVYDVKGGFLGLGDALVTALTFVNLDDKYEYPATVNKDGYSVSLRDGAYQAKAVAEGYRTQTHVVVAGKAVGKDLMFVSTSAAPELTRVSDIYVGYPNEQNNYNTVRDAVAACEAMKPASEAERITVHIAPGIYREQIVLKTPYISFVNDTDKEVLITWYYGIGYQYYSAGDNGFYDPERAYDKYEKHIAEKWGTTIFVQPAAMGFRADGITFENSFNRYLTDEELEDGVEHTDSTIKVDRKYGLDVQSKAATERAAAIVVQADQVEFNDCAFYSSQDTVYGTNSGMRMYFKNCFIEGQTDYIFGDGSAVFDACELSWKGYSKDSTGGYITAHRPGSDSDKGYLFRNCIVSANDKLTVTTGYFGRPWGENARAVFLNTRLQSGDLIHAGGWSPWSGKDTDIPLLTKAYYKEYNTTLMDGGAVDISGRRVDLMTQAEAETVKVADYFGSWTPSFYREEAAEVAFVTKPFVTDNGDLNTPYPGHKLTVGYSIGDANDANDASLIQWYRVKDGKETLVKNAAVLDKTYKIVREDIGSRIKVVVTPITVSGNKGIAESCTVEAVVRDGYEDPDAAGGVPELGDGVNIFLAGDSTVKDYSAAGINSGGSARSEGAWGEFFQSYFNKEKVTVVNYANGGRSVRNFINEGSLDTIAGKIGEGDYLFIQFGHNDCSDIEAHLAERYVPLGIPDADGVYPVTPGEKQPTPAELANKNYGAECYTYDCGGTYKWYLKQYIDVAKNAGATPVLVTPVSRMYYNSDGSVKPHHDSANSTGKTQKTTDNAYVTAMKQLAQEQDVLLVDGFGLTKALFEDAWKNAAENGEQDKELYGKQIMHAGDKTHNNKLGGMIEAAVIASAIQNMELNISYAVKAPAQVMGETAEQSPKTVFVVNGSSKLTAYDVTSDYAERAPYWESTGQRMIDAIDEKAKELAGSGENPVPPTDRDEWSRIAAPVIISALQTQRTGKVVVKASGNVSDKGADLLKVVMKRADTIVDSKVSDKKTAAEQSFEFTVTESGEYTFIAYLIRKNEKDEKASEAKSCNVKLSSAVDPEKKGLYIVLTDGDEFEYTGSAIKPEIKAYNNGELLTAGVDYTVKYSNNIKACEWEEDTSAPKNAPRITVMGKGNLTGSSSTNFTIKAKDISDADVIKGDIIIAKGSKASPVLVYNNIRLGAKDYEFDPATDAKKKFNQSDTIKLKGKGSFSGNCELNVTVVEKKDLKKFNVEVGKESLTYIPGKVQKPAITVKDKTSRETLTENIHYTIVYGGDQTSAGTQKFTVIGMGMYSGTVAKSYKIKPLAVKDESAISLTGIDQDGYLFTAAGVTLGDDLKVIYKCKNESGVEEDILLAQGKDYKVSYSNNKKVGDNKAKCRITFLGNYKGSKARSVSFSIKAAPLGSQTDGLRIEAADKTYKKPNQYKSAPYVSIDGMALKSSDYTVRYYLDAAMTQEMSSQNKVILADDAVSATIYVKIVGKGNYAPKDESTFAATEYQVWKVGENQKDLSKARVTFVDASGSKLTKATYTGEEMEPAVKVEIKNGKTWETIPADQYELTYVNNVHKGKATAIINAKGVQYVGGRTAAFSIVAQNLKNRSDLWGNLAQIFLQ